MDNKYHRTPAEVAAESSIEHTGKGVLNTVKGSVRQAWGKLVGSPQHRVGGKIDELKGRAQVGLGKLEAKEAELESRAFRDEKEDEL